GRHRVNDQPSRTGNEGGRALRDGIPAAAGVTPIVVGLCGQPPYQDYLPGAFCLVEPGGLEPPTPCMQIALSACDQCPDLVNGTSVVARGVPLVTVVCGTLRACRLLTRWFGLGRERDAVG